MKNLFIFSFLILGSSVAIAQAFSDCVKEYHVEWNKIDMQLFRKELDQKAADSLKWLLYTAMDNCILGKEMPEYKFVSLTNELYTNESLKGKVVMFNFWSVNCGPCFLEIPVLNKLHHTYKDNKDFVLISVLQDSEENLRKSLERGLTKWRIFFEVIPDAKITMNKDFRIKMYPTNLFVNKEGKIFMQTTGGITDPKHEPELEAKLSAIIDGELRK